jgi:hypothetical protein
VRRRGGAASGRFGHAAIANLAVATGQPGDGAFDHWPMSPIFVAPLWVSCLTAGFPLQRMVWADPDDSSGDAGGAAPTQRAAAARRSERRPALAAELRVTLAGQVTGAVDIIDSEIVDAEPAWDSRPGRCGFDQIDVAALYQFGTPASSSPAPTINWNAT